MGIRPPAKVNPRAAAITDHCCTILWRLRHQGVPVIVASDDIVGYPQDRPIRAAGCRPHDLQGSASRSRRAHRALNRPGPVATKGLHRFIGSSERRRESSMRDHGARAGRPFAAFTATAGARVRRRGRSGELLDCRLDVLRCRSVISSFSSKRGIGDTTSATALGTPRSRLRIRTSRGDGKGLDGGGGRPACHQPLPGQSLSRSSRSNAPRDVSAYVSQPCLPVLTSRLQFRTVQRRRAGKSGFNLTFAARSEPDYLLCATVTARASTSWSPPELMLLSLRWPCRRRRGARRGPPIPCHPEFIAAGTPPLRIGPVMTGSKCSSSPRLKPDQRRFPPGPLHGHAEDVPLCRSRRTNAYLATVATRGS